MKIIHLQYQSDSAGKQAIRIQNAFLNRGIDSSIISLYGDIKSNKLIKVLGKGAKIISNVDSKLQYYLTRNSNKEFGLFSYPILGTDVSTLVQILEADVIYIHWVLFGFLSLSNIEQLAKLNKPLIFFMHDMWTITGGCHYSFDCKRYELGCGECPIFWNHKKDDLSALEYKKKKSFLQNTKIYILYLQANGYIVARNSPY